jgi:molybdopterin molybdotransferase
MLELEQAVEKILRLIPGAGSERIPLIEAYKRVATEPIVAEMDLPSFDNSSVDGYAVRAQDVAKASAQNPIPLNFPRVNASGYSRVHLCLGEPMRW